MNVTYKKKDVSLLSTFQFHLELNQSNRYPLMNSIISIIYIATIIRVCNVRQYVTYHMMRLGRYVIKNRLPKEIRVIAVSDPISLGIDPVKKLVAIIFFGTIDRNM